MKKLSAVLTVLFLAPPLSAASLAMPAPHGVNCRVVSVDPDLSVWEEGLGQYGDPNVDGDSQNVYFSMKNGKIDYIRVGQMTWDSDSAKITVKPLIAEMGTTYLYTVTEGGEFLQLKVFPSQRGVVLHRPEPGAKLGAVATFDCSSVEEMETARPESRNARVMTSAQFAKLPKDVRDNMAKVEMAVEMGDGYYDLEKSKTYAVYSTANPQELIGYIEWGHFEYTEGDDVEAFVRFDRNGLRLGEIESQSVE